jgi:hypothetical protein
MIDLVLAVRADEASHRYVYLSLPSPRRTVLDRRLDPIPSCPTSCTDLDLPCRFLNHTLSNLEAGDHNPFGLKRPSAIMQGTLTGLTREESKVWGAGVENDMSKGDKRD